MTRAEANAEIAKRLGREHPKDRCGVCGWPLKEMIRDGCTADSCSMRPAPPRRADAPPDYFSLIGSQELARWFSGQDWLKREHFAAALCRMLKIPGFQAEHNLSSDDIVKLLLATPEQVARAGCAALSIELEDEGK